MTQALHRMSKYGYWLAGLFAISLAAQQPTMEQANRFFQDQDYREAARAYRLILADDSTNGMAWLRLAGSYYHLQRYDNAIPAYERADALGIYPPYVRYNLACALALTGNQEAAFSWLEKALDTGFAGLKQLERDEDLARLRRDDRFLTLLQRAEENAHPCEYDERYRQFDFWLGEWHVYNPSGTRVGTNRIEKTLGGCMLQENWVSAGGIAGKSTNYFDPGTGKWVQIWVSQGGDNIYYEGIFKDGGMHFQGERADREGKIKLSRMVIEPMGDSGKVRQVIETSEDEGVTWALGFEGIYIPAGQDPRP
ncbi:MAG: tetratricopeptide repeat protein [Lentisphaeria bacterium]|nr:tetratricopeptide repeat protein [Candidatus Neomarinimicrobiota bacterium]MCF7842613.1 tetratricopeptide repeat protein [Lentisphaeria bacterium]